MAKIATAISVARQRIDPRQPVKGDLWRPWVLGEFAHSRGWVVLIPYWSNSDSADERLINGNLITSILARVSIGGRPPTPIGAKLVEFPQDPIRPLSVGLSGIPLSDGLPCAW
jgi:hypothetical protein